MACIFTFGVTASHCTLQEYGSVELSPLYNYTFWWPRVAIYVDIYKLKKKLHVIINNFGKCTFNCLQRVRRVNRICTKIFRTGCVSTEHQASFEFHIFTHDISAHSHSPVVRNWSLFTALCHHILMPLVIPSKQGQTHTVVMNLHYKATNVGFRQLEQMV